MVGAEPRGEQDRSDETEPVRPPTIGQIVDVYVREEENPSSIEDVSNHEANVILGTGKEEPRTVPIVQDFPGTAGVPKVGDTVLVEYTRSATEKPVITGYVYTRTDNRPPLAREGHWRREFNELYIEAERVDHGAIDPGNEDYDVIRLAKKANGLSDPTTQVALDDSGAATEVRIETDGDITISAGGDVVIDEGGSTKSVLTEDAVFEYEDTGDTGDGSATPTTKTTTTVSNGETTKTQIE